MTVCIYNNCYTGWNGCSINPGDICIRRCCPPNADSARLVRNTTIANIDIVTAYSEIATGITTHGDVVAASCFAKERFRTDGRVVAAGCVEKERTNTVR